MNDTSFKWTCITCDKEIPQHLEYCAECEEKRYRKIGGLLYLPLINILFIAYSYFNSLAVTLSAGMGTLGRLPISQTIYLFIAAGVNQFSCSLSFILFLCFYVKRRIYPWLIVHCLFRVSLLC